jgi:hypothetical protein
VEVCDHGELNNRFRKAGLCARKWPECIFLHLLIQSFWVPCDLFEAEIYVPGYHRRAFNTKNNLMVKPAFLNLLFSSPWSQTSTITYLNLTCKISSPVTYHEGGSGHYSDSPLLRRPIIPTAHCSDSPFLRKPIIPSKMVKSSIIILKPVVFLLYLTED